MKDFINMSSDQERTTYLHSLVGDDKYEALNTIINTCDHIVFFGGAGVSTESGIPDFRSKDGLYNQKDIRFEQYKPEYLLSHDCLVYHPDVFFEFYRQKMDARGCKPNAAHKKLAEMEAAGKLDAIITQNIDGLHQHAGNRKVFEVHGTTEKNYCSRCGKKYPSDYIFNCGEKIPHCTCGGIIRPDVTLYGESLPELAWERSINALSIAQCFIVGGTSLTVYPAASLLHYFRGTFLIICNRGATQYDQNADLIFRENIGEVFSKIHIQRE